MIDSAEQYLRLRTSPVPEDYRRATRDRVPLAVWYFMALRHPWVRAWIALNQYVPPVMLALLAADEDWRVRAVVATRPNLTWGILERLARDASPDVRLRVARNPDTPRHVLISLLDDDVDQVRHTAKARLEAEYAAGA